VPFMTVAVMSLSVMLMIMFIVHDSPS
jgi:hypothetical protein